MRNPQQTGPGLRARLVPAGTLGAIGGAAVTGSLLFLAYLAIGGGGGENEVAKIRRIPQRAETRGSPTTTPRMAGKGEAPKYYRPEGKEEDLLSPKSERIPAEETKAEPPQATLPDQEVTSGIEQDPRGPWVVNTVSLLSKSGAQDFQAKLEKEGWNSYTSEIPQGDRLWYGVRVGFFRSRDEASQAAQKISKQYQLQGCMVLRRPAE